MRHVCDLLVVEEYARFVDALEDHETVTALQLLGAWKELYPDRPVPRAVLEGRSTPEHLRAISADKRSHRPGPLL